jgi:guanylate kinase
MEFRVQGIVKHFLNKKTIFVKSKKCFVIVNKLAERGSSKGSVFCARLESFSLNVFNSFPMRD